MPPVPPQVSYRNGMLTVNAINSTMSSVLSAIRAKTGIQFDGAENSAERVAVNLGPAPEGDVLAGIFSGSSFDYVVLGRPDSPGTVQRVILTPRGRGGAGAVAGQPQQPMQQPPAQAQAQAQQEGDEDTPAEDAADQEPQDAPVQPPPVQEPPTAQNQQQNQNNQPKTPEQLLEELKQMQLQQQQQQGQPPPDPNSVPRKMPPR